MPHYLDASGMEPPEPMECVLQLLADLAAGEYIHMYHRMEPTPLYGVLHRAGFRWRTAQDSQGMYHIFIWRNSDAEAEREAAAHSTDPAAA